MKTLGDSLHVKINTKKTLTSLIHLSITFILCIFRITDASRYNSYAIQFTHFYRNYTELCDFMIALASFSLKPHTTIALVMVKSVVKHFHSHSKCPHAHI